MLPCKHAGPFPRANTPQEVTVPVALYFITLSLPHLHRSLIRRLLNLWPLFHTKPVYWGQGEETPPTTQRKRKARCQLWISCIQRRGQACRPGQHLGPGPSLQWDFSGMLVLPAGESTGAPNGLSHPVQAICLLGLFPTHLGPITTVFWLIACWHELPLILPRKSAVLAVLPPVPVFLILPSLHRHHLVEEWQPGGKLKKKERKEKRKGEREKKTFREEILHTLFYPQRW